MKSKIIIVGFNTNFNKQVANLVSERVDLFFLDLKDYIEYSLQNIELMQEKCGFEYLKKQENSVIKSCVDFENTVINFPIEYYNLNDAYKLFIGNSEIVYIRFLKNSLNSLVDKNDLYDNFAVDLIAYKDYDALLKKTASIVIDCEKKSVNEVAEIVSVIIKGN